MPNPTAAMLVIGDEILSGRTRDANMHHLAGKLTEHGVNLSEVRIVPDYAPMIETAVKELAARYDHVFTSGGIGPTHDDITADCIARAFDDHIDIRADASALLGDYYASKGQEFNDARKRMARIPDRATLIDNPVSVAPGFTLENVHVMAGVPAVFEAMVDSVLPLLTGGTPLQSKSVRIERGESDIAGPLAKLANEHTDLSFGSYPFIENGKFGANIVIRGTDTERLEFAAHALIQMFPEDT